MSSKAGSGGSAKAAKYEGVGRGSDGGDLRYLQVDQDSLRECVDKVTRAGDAVLFSLTSDGGAFSVRVLADKQVHKWYPESVAALETLLGELASAD